MFAFFRRHSRKISIFLTLNLLVSLLPPRASALTSGPSQPETQQFAPAGMDNMVDPFTGDFSYNIPLMDVGGYPINLNYAAGITPDQEASWVGLGWNLNVGAINRSVRGLPDDFAGEEVRTTYNVKPNQTFGLNFSFDPTKLELWGFKVGASTSMNLFYNNYNGFGFSLGFRPSIDLPLGDKSNYKVGLGTNFSLDSEGGVGITPSFGLGPRNDKDKQETGLGATISFPYSTREGLKGMSLSTSYSYEGKDSEGGSVTRSGGGGGFIGFAAPTYTPSVQHDFINANGTVTLSSQLTNEAFENGIFGLGGYYSGQYLRDKVKKNPAFGYMYSGLDGGNLSALHDFNREKDNNGFNESTKNLAVTAYTYDTYSVSGQGVGGTYRLFRGDVGEVGDPMQFEENHVGEVGLGFGAGSTPSTKINVDVNYVNVGSGSTRWQNAKIQNFNNPTKTQNTQREYVYFRRIGEKAPETDFAFLNNVQKGTDAFTYNLISNSGYLDGSILDKRSNSIGNIARPAQNKRNARRKRNNQFTYLLANETQITNQGNGDPITQYPVGSIKNYFFQNYREVNSEVDIRKQRIAYSYEELSRMDEYRKGHHISEVSVTDNSGARYHYGIPVYNKKQEEVTFSVDIGNDATTRRKARETGLVPYSPSDASLNNSKGLDHNFNKVETPAFATSYLLTSILSSDYVDSDGIEGPTDGDLGNYTKFNYSKTSDNFKWRTPYQEDMASFTDAMETKSSDDKANYLYGEKEIWYIHSIETRTHVAEFYLSERKDGHGVKSKRGGLSTSQENTLYKLDRIELYSKADKLNAKAEPIKTVHFEYDYLLCPNTPNSSAEAPDQTLYPGHPGKGKLTLKKIWFTYGSSGKGVLNPYEFNYADTDFDGIMDNNPEYNIKEYDRWSTYKKQNDTLRNEVFPYTRQNKESVDKYCAVYAMTSINTPTGGSIRVHYESDDYAYVQNRRAMRMFTIKGFSSGKNGTANEALYTHPDDINSKLYMHVDLGEGFIARDNEHANEILRKEYLDGIDLLYYKAKLNVINLNFGSGQEFKEFVPGYAEIDISNSIAKPTNNGENKFTTAVIKLKSDRTKGLNPRDVNPIAHNGWMYAKLNLGRELKGLGDASSASVLQVMYAMVAQLDNILTFFTGFNTAMASKGNSNQIDSDESFVRLNDYDKIKLGGGHRVKAIIMSDNWDKMTAQKELPGQEKEVAYYGQKYDYTRIETSPVKDQYGKPTTRTISSGVAAYEPMVGNDENPFRLPVFSVQKIPLAPSREFYLEEPFGEMFFPSPTVGYSKVVTTPVKITSTDYDIYNLPGNGTGYVEQEFYTAKDFPVITERTELIHKRDKPDPETSFLKIGGSDIVTCSQGYKVELNDMHGKEKSKKVMPDAPSDGSKEIKPISYVQYFYKQKPNGDLSNSVRTIKPENGALKIIPESEQVQFGLEVDVVHDTKHYRSQTAGGGLDFNTKGIFPVIPIIGIVPMPTFNFETVEFKSVVTTKVINRYGILEKTVAMDNGQTITTENLAWDEETGEVLLTKVENEFHDPIWSFTYPAYWHYPSMEPAYINEGTVYENTQGSLEAFKTHLKDGDEFLCEHNGGAELVYYDAEQDMIMNRLGAEITDIDRLKIIRSGGRNMPMTPIGSISCLDDPLRDGNALQFTRVLNAGVTEFQFVWKAFCNCFDQETEVSTNPFVLGRRGSLRPLKSWTYLTERKQTRTNDNPDISQDGYFTDVFQPFWIPVANTDSVRRLSKEEVNESKWQYVTQIENYNQIGMEIENKDALERYSMAQFGYGRNLPVATSNNSKYQESGFDGFEDYDYGDCNDDHFSWRSKNVEPSSQEAHTGRKSIKIGKNSSLKIKKIIQPCNEEGTGGNGGEG